MSSDVATAIGSGGGWFIDNLVINNMASAGCAGGLAQANVTDGFGATHARLASRRVGDVNTSKLNTDPTASGPRRG